MRVWAPRARTVDLILPGSDDAGDSVQAMAAEPDGWWQSETPLPHGTDYGFSLDGGPLRPDPRSAWQPAGVHGPSRVFDPDTITWADGAWAGRDARGAVIYELHLGTFAGDLDAAIGRLGHLVDLGVEMVELLPVAPFNGRHGWGYDGVGLYGVHAPYGGPAALARFVDAAHRVGLAVCLDVVHNHLGPSGNYLGEFGPYFTDAHQTPWGAAVDLSRPEVRSWIIESVLRWLRDFHLDALRLDAVHALIDDSPRHLLADMSDAVTSLSRGLGRPLSLIAESDLNDPISITPTEQGGWGMTAQWADDVHHAIHALLTGERQGYYVDFGAPATLAHAMTRVFVHDGGHSTFRDRDWGRPVPDGVDGHRFVVFGSDHDQVGNRALGDRPSARLDDATLAAEAALVLLSPFTPMLFMGEEWGARTPWMFFTDHPEPDLAEAVRQGRTAEFGSHGWAAMYASADADFTVPDPQDPATVDRSRLDWAEAELLGHARMLDWYRTLITLRREVAALGDGDRSRTRLTWDVTADQPPAPVESPDTREAASPLDPAPPLEPALDQNPASESSVPLDHSPEAARARAWRSWLVLHRGDARVAINLADHEQTVPLDRGGDPRVLATWAAGGARVLPDPTAAAVVLPPHTVTVLA